MIKGIPIECLYPKEGAADSFGNVEDGFEDPVTIDNVLCIPVSTADLGSERPDGIKVDVRFYFPKSYDGKSLRGAKLSYEGNLYTVLGEPEKFFTSPTDYNMVVEAVRDDG